VRAGSVAGALLTACSAWIVTARSTMEVIPQPARPAWTASATGVTARLRGISAVSDRVVWASGNGGTIIRTDDGGKSWKRIPPPDAGSLDFRDIDAVDERTAYALSIGPGDASRIYKTTDAGTTWTLQFRNDNEKAFYDAMAFAGARTGFAVSDSIDGRLVVLRTVDGARWSRVLPEALPAAIAGEGAYAASGTNIAIVGRRVWIGTTASRVVRSMDGGGTWSAFSTPLPAGTSAGIFSIAFRDANHGIVVGGDYKEEREAFDNAAITADAGASWTIVRGLGGYRSAVAFMPAREGTLLSVGPSGSDYSDDNGRTWRAIEGPGFHTLAVAPGSRVAWAAGENGTAASLTFDAGGAGAGSQDRP
jgi:photosystem II stability/assembly factor-like uncharacterized protein